MKVFLTMLYHEQQSPRWWLRCFTHRHTHTCPAQIPVLRAEILQVSHLHRYNSSTTADSHLTMSPSSRPSSATKTMLPSNPPPKKKLIWIWTSVWGGGVSLESPSMIREVWFLLSMSGFVCLFLLVFFFFFSKKVLSRTLAGCHLLCFGRFVPRSLRNEKGSLASLENNFSTRMFWRNGGVHLRSLWWSSWTSLCVKRWLA